MARKPRDYKAEERARNARAVASGFKNRAEMRRAMERGAIPAARPHRLTSPETKRTQRALRDSIDRGNGLPDPAAFAKWIGGKSQTERCRDWSDARARTSIVSYDTKSPFKDVDGKADPYAGQNAAKREFIATHGRQAYTDAYLSAFVEGPERYATAKTRTGGSHALYYWLVVVVQYMSAKDYEEKYGPLQ